MRKLDGILVMTIVAAVAASSYSALAKGSKSTSNLLTNTATGKHYDKTTLTPHKPKTPVAEQKASKKSGNSGKNPDPTNPNGSGASAGKSPNPTNPNGSGASAGKNPNPTNPNGSGASAGKNPDPTNPNGSGASAGKNPDPTNPNDSGASAGKNPDPTKPNGSGASAGNAPNNGPNSTGTTTANDKPTFLKFEFKSVAVKTISGDHDPPPPPPPPPPMSCQLIAPLRVVSLLSAPEFLWG